MRQSTRKKLNSSNSREIFIKYLRHYIAKCISTMDNNKIVHSKKQEQEKYGLQRRTLML